MISGAVENNVQVQWKFDQFFPRCDEFSKRLDVVVYSLVTAEYYHCYVTSDATYVIILSVHVVKQLNDTALLNKLSHSYGVSLALWDHTALPATRQSDTSEHTPP